MKVLKTKLTELGIRSYRTARFPQGRKIRVRAGPFPIGRRRTRLWKNEAHRRFGVGGGQATTLFDWVIVAIIAASLLLGLWRGVVGTDRFGGLGVGHRRSTGIWPPLGHSVFAGIGDATLRTLAGCAALFVGVLVAMALLRLAVRGLIKALGLGCPTVCWAWCSACARDVDRCWAWRWGNDFGPRQPWWRQATLAVPWRPRCWR